MRQRQVPLGEQIPLTHGGQAKSQSAPHVEGRQVLHVPSDEVVKFPSQVQTPSATHWPWPQVEFPETGHCNEHPAPAKPLKQLHFPLPREPSLQMPLPLQALPFVNNPGQGAHVIPK